MWWKVKENFMMPALKKVIKHTDIKAKTITVDAKIFIGKWRYMKIEILTNFPGDV